MSEIRKVKRAPLWGLIIFAALFIRPYPLDIVGRLGVRLIDVLIVVFLVLYLAIVCRYQRIKFPIEAIAIFVLLSLMTLLSLISSVYANVQGVSNVDFRDILDSMRYIQFTVFIAFGFVLARSSKFTNKGFLNVILFLGILTVAFGVLQKLFPGPSYLLTQLYTPEHQGSRLFSTQRVTAFFGNPNTAALMMSGFILYVLSYLAQYKYVITKAEGKKYYFYILAFIFFIFLCGSRTGLLTFLGSLVLYLMITKPFFKWAPGVIFVVFLILIFREPILLQIRDINVYLYSGLRLILYGEWDTLINVGSTISSRFLSWQNTWSFFQSSPLIGLGPLRGVISSSTDNFYLYLLVRIGAIGLTFYLLSVLIVLVVAVRMTKSPNPTFGYFLFLLTILILVANLTLEAQILINMTYLYYISLGVLLSQYSLIRKDYKAIKLKADSQIMASLKGV